MMNFADERNAELGMERDQELKRKRSLMRKTRTGLQITGAITLREWLVIQDKDVETDPGIQYVEELFGRLVITMSQDEQEHVKRYLRGLITEEELIQEVS
jgi:hypothetical protein